MLDPFNDSRNEGGGASAFAGEAPGHAAGNARRQGDLRLRRARPPQRLIRGTLERLGLRLWRNSTVSGNAAAGTHATTSRIYGTAVGADYRVSPDTRLGFALGGAGFNFGVDGGLGGGRADLFQAGLFGRHSLGPAYLAAALAYGWQDVTTDRTVTVAGTDLLRANFKANTFAARGEAGYRFAVAFDGPDPLRGVAGDQFPAAVLRRDARPAAATSSRCPMRRRPRPMSEPSWAPAPTSHSWSRMASSRCAAAPPGHMTRTPTGRSPRPSSPCPARPSRSTARGRRPIPRWSPPAPR